MLKIVSAGWVCGPSDGSSSSITFGRATPAHRASISAVAAGQVPEI
jgi:hypothetical protein